MSVVVSGPRRIYVLLLFRERLSDGARSSGVDLVAGGRAVGRPPARLALSARLQRRLGRSLFGLSFFVLALDEAARR